MSRCLNSRQARFLILEYAPCGELFEYLIQKGALDINEARRIFKQIVEGVGYCHRHLIWYGDGAGRDDGDAALVLHVLLG